MKHAHVVYRVNHYPEHGEPDMVPDAVFSSVVQLKKALAKAREQYPSIYGDKDIVIRKIKMDRWFELV